MEGYPDPKLIVFLMEGTWHTYRQIFMDGRGHPRTWTPPGRRLTASGKNTLVVDTVGFNDKFWLMGPATRNTESYM